MNEEQKKKFLQWIHNHPDVWHKNGSTEHMWWVQNCLGDVFGWNKDFSDLVNKIYADHQIQS